MRYSGKASLDTIRQHVAAQQHNAVGGTPVEGTCLVGLCDECTVVVSDNVRVTMAFECNTTINIKAYVSRKQR